MIPKVASFYWEGEPMSWLRQQSIETFKKHNPDWEVVMIERGDVPIQVQGRLGNVLRSDWRRYQHLYDNGGFYFDTDIVFCNPIPDEWLEHDLVLPLGKLYLVGHVASLGASKQNSYIGFAVQACKEEFRRGEIFSYQHFGVELLDKVEKTLAGMDIKWIDESTFLPFPYFSTERIWRESSERVPTLTVGIHWFGGDWLSMDMEPKVNEEWARTSKSVLAKALRGTDV